MSLPVYPSGAGQTLIASAGGLDFKSLAEQYGKLTVRELVTSTSGLALAQLVAARAAIQLATLVDARRFCRVEMVPPGGGKTYHFQVVKIPDSSFETEMTEGTDVSAADTTMNDVTATLTIYTVRTDISDLAQRQAAVNLAEVVGIAHGNALNRKINLDVWASIAAATTCNATVGAANDGRSTNYTFNELMYVKGLVERQRGRADTFVTFPYMPAVGSGGAPVGFYPFIMGNITSVQFTTALAQYVSSGQISELFGLRLYVDKVFEPSNPAQNGALLGAVLVGGESVGWAQAEDIVSEVQRWAPAVGFRIVTHVTGKSALVMEPWTGIIKHA